MKHRKNTVNTTKGRMMRMRHKLPILILVLFTFPLLLLQKSFAQESLSERLKTANQLIHLIENEKKSLKQHIETNEARPYKIKFTTIETSLKSGKSKEESWSFNLADIDARLIQYKTSSKEIAVLFKTENNQKLINRSSEGNVKGYTNQFKIVANNIDNARELQIHFRESVPLAKLSWEQQLGVNLKNFDQILNTLNNISMSQTIRSKQIDQQIKVDKQKDRITVTKTTKGKNGKHIKERFTLSMADLLRSSLQIKSGKSISVELKLARKQKLIQKAENGKVVGYSNKLSILARDAEQAKLIQTLLLHSIEPSIVWRNRYYNSQLSNTSPFQALANLVDNIQGDKISIRQSITTQCFANYQQETTKTNGKVENQQIRFNFGLLNPNSIQAKPTKTWITITSNTRDKLKLIQKHENKEERGYENHLSISFRDAESAQRALYLLPKVIDQCNRPVAKADWAWVSKSTKAVNNIYPEIEQSFEPQGDQCKATFTSSIRKKRAIEESFYELNLRDLDENQLEYGVHAKKLLIALKTRYKEKSIKLYRDNKPRYVSHLDIIQQDVPSARKFLATIKSLVAQCDQG